MSQAGPVSFSLSNRAAAPKREGVGKLAGAPPRQGHLPEDPEPGGYLLACLPSRPLRMLFSLGGSSCSGVSCIKSNLTQRSP